MLTINSSTFLIINGKMNFKNITDSKIVIIIIFNYYNAYSNLYNNNKYNN